MKYTLRERNTATGEFYTFEGHDWWPDKTQYMQADNNNIVLTVNGNTFSFHPKEWNQLLRCAKAGFSAAQAMIPSDKDFFCLTDKQ